uniref:Odorant receptor OR3 n=1 Tax=Colaphellus bowringi TaxID=561076 RepID=A0A0S3J2Q2_9CUCU|nr:odorant receptor OR3 [Colaphellus bowringi]
MATITNSLFVILEIGICIIKFLPFKNDPKKIRKTLFALNQDMFNRATESQRRFIEETEAACRNIFAIFMTFCLLSLFSWPIKVLFYEQRRFPIDVWLPFDPFENVSIYLGVFAYLFIATGNAPIGNAAIDTLIAGLIIHAACQFRILKDNLRCLSQRADEKLNGLPQELKEMKRNEIVYRNIRECILHYDAIYDFVKEVEKTFSVVIFSQFAVSILVICISCFQLSIAEPLTITFFAMVIYVVSLLLEIFLYCYYGTVLYEESNTLIAAIFDSEWYDLDEKSKKALFILMERAKRPMMLTTGKLLSVSLETWTMIIRRSYSLLAVLKNHQ